MREMLLLLPDDGALPKIVATLASLGGHVLQRYGRTVVLVEADETLVDRISRELSEEVRVFSRSVPETDIPSNDVSAQMGIAAWNERHTPRFLHGKLNRPGRGLSWGEAGFEREGDPSTE